MKKLSFVLLILFAVSISCTSPDQAGISQLDKGTREFRAGNTARALEIFENAASKYPESPDAQFGMVYYYYNEGFIYEALDACNDIIRDNTNYKPALSFMAKMCLDIDRPEMAYFFSSLYRDAGGDEDEAALIEMNSFLAAGKIDDAHESIDKALANMPTHPVLMIAKARCDLHSANVGEAVDIVGELLKNDSLEDIVCRAAGNFYMELGLFDSAAVYFDKTLEAVDNDQAYYFKAGIIKKYIEMKYYDRALKMLAPYADNFPASNIYYDLLSTIYMQQGKFQEASHYYGMIVPNHSKSPSILERFALTKAKLGDKFAAERYFETGVLLARRDSLSNIANVALRMSNVDMLFELGQFKNATQTVEAMLDSLPNDFKAIYNGCFLSMMNDDRDRMRDLLLIAQPKIENNPTYMIQLSEIYRLSDSLDTARDMLLEAAKADKFNSDAVLMLIKVAKKAGRLSEALNLVNSFDEYLSYNSEVAEAKLELYDAVGEYASGFQFAEQLIAVGKEDVERYKWAADMAIKMNDRKKAEAIYQQCLENNPDNASAHAFIGKYYLGRNNIEQAESLMNKAVSLDSLNIDALVLKADLAAHNGQIDEAIKIYTRVIELNQFEADAVGGLALQELLRGDNPNIAANRATKAIMYDGGNAWHRTTRGRAFYALEKYRIASISFKEALDIDPDNPLINYYAGLNYVKMDTMNFEAKMHLKKAIKDGLPKDLEKKARTALKEL